MHHKIGDPLQGCFGNALGDQLSGGGFSGQEGVYSHGASDKTMTDGLGADMKCF
jgi:hypothetical protein